MLEQELADGERPVEGLAEQFLAGQHPGQRYLLAGDNGDAPFGRVGGRGVAVDRRRLEGQLDATDSCQVDGEAQQIRAVGQGRQGPGERQREVILVLGVLPVGQVDDLILEGQSTRGSTSRARWRSRGPLQPSSGCRSTSQAWRRE